MLFTANESAILSCLRGEDSADLATLSMRCGLARSSVHSAVGRLIDLGLVLNTNPEGKAVYRIAGRDGLERAMQQIVTEFRDHVSVPHAAGKPVLAFTDNYLLPESQLQELRSRYEVRTFPQDHTYRSDELFAERARDAEVIVRFDFQPVDADFLAQMPNLKAVVFPNCVVANVDVKACEEFGVSLHNTDPATHKYYATTQVEYVLNAALTLLKPLSRFKHQVESFSNYYDWAVNIDEDLCGKNVGFVFQQGNIRTLVQMFQLLGCAVRAANTLDLPPLTSEVSVNHYDTIEDVWQKSDIVVILEGVELALEPLLDLERCPDYLICGSGDARYSSERMRDQVISQRLKGLAIDMIPHEWGAVDKAESFERSIAPLRDLPNVIITGEVEVFSQESIARSHARVFDVLMNLALS